MERRRPLSEVFLSALREAPSAELVADRTLDLALGGLVASGEAAWPEIRVAPEAFVRFVAERIAPGEGSSAVGRLRAADLYLACACRSGDERAIAAVDSTYGRSMDSALRRLGLSPEACEEVRQRVREMLFVAKTDAQPKIADYSGRGDLRSWVCVVVVRAAGKMKRSQAAQRIDELDPPREHVALVARSADPELAYIKRYYRSEFKEAFSDAIASLSRQERNLLRHNVLDGLSIDEIAGIYKLHRSTAARQLARARAALFSHTRRILAGRLCVSEPELDSIANLLESEVDVSLSRHLADSRGGASDDSEYARASVELDEAVETIRPLPDKPSDPRGS